jgi:YegS/Rv2252/BmrU family lipid kinase
MNYFIYNPISGNYSKKKRAALLQKINVNSENIVFETNNKDEEYAVTQKAIQLGAKKVIAIGGDGTINKVASALINTDISLGIIPMGSGNGLARHLGISLKSLDAVDKAITGKPIKIDACRINDQLFFCTAGMGFDAAVAELFDKRGKRGFINYILAVLITMFKFRTIEVEYTNGKTEELFLLTIANANQYGNNAFISPFSNIQDGTFEIIKIKKNSTLRLFSIGMRLFMKNIHKSSEVEIIPVSSFKLIQKLKQPMHLDGESISFNSTKLEVSILPSALNVII